jgi:RNA polymerase-binding transcription factor DksA
MMIGFTLRRHDPTAADRATREAAQTLELHTRDCYRKLLGKIDATPERIDNGTYGWCEDTGEPTGLARPRYDALCGSSGATRAARAANGQESRQKLNLVYNQ